MTEVETVFQLVSLSEDHEEPLWASDGDSARVCVHRGRVLHAQLGDLEGPDAVYALMGRGVVRMGVRRGRWPLLQSVTVGWDLLRQEARRLAREGRIPQPASESDLTSPLS